MAKDKSPRLPIPPKTGWAPGLLQDDERKLSIWFASRPDARQRVREAVAHILSERTPS